MKLNKLLTFILVFVLMLTCVSINTLADDNVDYLDLESTETYKDSKDLDQNYTYTQTGDVTYTDTTKVKLTWTINDIEATYTSHKTWDPTNLQWTEAKEGIDVTNSGAEFTLTNYSSEGIIANVKFEVEESLKDTFDKVTYTNNNCAIKTPVTVDNNTYQDSDFTALNKTITSEITFNKDEFADLSDTTSATKYGTYTVTIKGAQYLTFTANEAASSVTPNFMSGTWQYSTDNGKNWTDGTNYVADRNGNVTSGTKTTITLTKAGEQVMLRGIDCQTCTDTQGNLCCFSMTGSISASGDVTALTNGIGGNETLTDYCYAYMFYCCQSLTTAPALPSETLAERCYGGMFAACALTTAPALPATTLAKGCYQNMFLGCILLTTAPALPATTLAGNCYLYMFNNCTSLVTAPALPATTLAECCYGGMFGDCTSLVTAPALPATTLVESCYAEMFSGCTSLVTAPVLPATTLANGCYVYMFSGCTSLVTAPALPATTLAETCYGEMFSGCTSLVTAPVLPATTLAETCYAGIFAGCTSLKVTKQPTGTEGTDWGVILGGAKTIETNAVYNMFNGCICASGVEATPTLGENITYYWSKE